MPAEPSKNKPQPKRAPTFYLIIIGKLLKGALSLAVALGVLSLASRNLPDIFAHVLNYLHLDPENRFFSEVSEKLDTVTPANVRWVALGTFIYSLFSLVEGVGLLFRISWAGWLTIGESAFFIPIELRELVHRPHFSWFIFGVLAFNVLIVWYLYANRQRLFRHHRH
jgi:uncharacterized membrane protein (DUF2068 family)